MIICHEGMKSCHSKQAGVRLHVAVFLIVEEIPVANTGGT